jgi:hypothetical protein
LEVTQRASDEHVDFDAGVIRVRRGCDEVEGEQDVTTDAAGAPCRSPECCAARSPRTS